MQCGTVLLCKRDEQGAKSGIDMSHFDTSKIMRSPFEKKEYGTKIIKFCITIIMDTTGCMKDYIEATKNNITNVLTMLQDEVKRLKLSRIIQEGYIVGQVVEYKDFNDTISSTEFITEDFTRLKVKLATFDADGGGDYCEDIQDRFEEPL